MIRATRSRRNCHLFSGLNCTYVCGTNLWDLVDLTGIEPVTS